ncbi:MAG TPA: ThuA domain-containing protein, partial [Polyangia bacterium]|nr:ThuA domain-containing protein [Polyangia bacterium]
AIAMAPSAMNAQAPGGGRGGGGVGAQLFTLFDADKDGAVTAAEIKTAFDGWYDAADSAKSGSVTQEQLSGALNTALGPPPDAPGGGAPGGRGPGGGGGRGPVEFVAGATTPGLNDPCGGRSQHPTVACPSDVEQMMAVLPAAAPAKPAKARKVLIFSRIPSAGYQHSSIPLAAKAIEELGKKTGAWTSDTSWDPAVFTADNLKQYDAIFLSSTTGCFLDKAGDKAATDARRAAFIEFVRGGKGVAGIHATGDSYHSPCPNDEGAGQRGGGFGRGNANGAGGTLASVILRWSWGLNDKKLQANDLTLTKADMDAVAAGWYKQLDPGGAGKVLQPAFANGIVPVATLDNRYVGSPGRDQGRGSWPDWDNMIGGWFKFHWLDPQHIVFKIDDKTSPLTKMFNGQDYDVYDETYTFSINSFSRENVHVLTSINYDKMSFMDKLKESNPRPDHDFGLSWIKRDGQGRMFYMAIGHDERIYALKPMMEHLLAGMQYALGDLKADDSPSRKKSTQH